MATVLRTKLAIRQEKKFSAIGRYRQGPDNNTAEYYPNTVSFHTVRAPGLPDWALVATIRYPPAYRYFSPPSAPSLSSSFSSLPSPSVLSSRHIPLLSFFVASISFATFTMAKGDVSQGDKSFMGMPVSLFLSLHRSAPCRAGYRFRAATTKKELDAIKIILDASSLWQAWNREPSQTAWLTTADRVKTDGANKNFRRDSLLTS